MTRAIILVGADALFLPIATAPGTGPSVSEAQGTPRGPRQDASGMRPIVVVGLVLATSALGVEGRAQTTADRTANAPAAEPRGVLGRLRARFAGQEPEKPRSRAAASVPPPSAPRAGTSRASEPA